MPRGKYVNHKGRGRSFTSPEELAREQKDLELKKLKKRQQQEAGIESEEEEESDEGAKQEEAAAKGSSEEEQSGSEDEDGNQKAKGVEGLIEIENPNRRVMKAKKPSTKVESDTGAGASSSSTAAAAGGAEKPELSRREREAIEKQRAKAHYQKLHAEGKTEEARKDLARLAIIRKQREEAALKRQQDQQEKETVKQNKQSEIGKALGKK